MKNNIVTLIALFLTIFISYGCCFGVNIEPMHEEKHLINISNLDYQLYNNGKEVAVKFEIMSDFTDNACLILKVAKEFSSNEPYRYEGFKNSLIIDDFHVRSYSITDSYDMTSPVDFPVYVKEIFINKGKNHESFKIVFPKDVASNAGNVYIDILVTIFNNEIKNSLKNIESFDHPFFEFFPDSSGTSYAFSEPSAITDRATTHGTEEISAKCIDFKNVSYCNFYYRRFYINR